LRIEITNEFLSKVRLKCNIHRCFWRFVLLSHLLHNFIDSMCVSLIHFAFQRSELVVFCQPLFFRYRKLEVVLSLQNPLHELFSLFVFLLDSFLELFAHELVHRQVERSRLIDFGDFEGSIDLLGLLVFSEQLIIKVQLLL
jgi:hypothetical protein